MTHNPGAKMGLAVSTLALIAGAALAAPPPADTVIGNQAAATYVSDGERFTVQSNLVETRVNEVFDVTLGTSQTRKGAPGSLTSFPHTINNNGNTNDRFDLAVDPAGGTDDFALNGLEVFPDADQDGVADSLTPISETPSIPVGESFGVIVRATAPSAATTGQTSDFDLTATSRGDPDVSQTNTDAVEITSQGIIDLAKVQTLANDAGGSGDISVGDTIAVTLTYSNTGIGAANDVVITDALPRHVAWQQTANRVLGLTGPEIAARTGLTPGSVRVNLHRGMKLLRERLGLARNEKNDE